MRQTGSAPGVRKGTLRCWVAALHRWLGLALMGFLLVAALTGSVMAFYPQLSALTAPSLFRAVAPFAGARPLDPLALRERLLQQRPGLQVDVLPLHVEPGRSLMFPVKPARSDGDDGIYVDPYSGRIQGQRRWGDIRQGMRNVVPFLYRIHYCLTVDGVGQKILGGVALMWLVASLLGLGLTLPPAVHGGVARWRMWRAAWRPRLRGSALGISFSVHRAGGLWLWPMFIVFAWSAVGLTLSQEVYQPVMRALGASVPPSIARLPQPRPHPGLTWDQALGLARTHMGEQLLAHGDRLEWEDSLRYDPTRAAFAYRVHTTADIGTRRAHSTLWIDATSGHVLAFQPTAGTTRGQTVSAWLFAMHRADLGDAAYRIFECLFGLGLAGMSISGAVLWWKRRVQR